MLSGGCAGGAVVVSGPCIKDENVAGGFQSYLGREIVPRSERNFSGSAEPGDWIAGPNALRTLKRIRTLSTPASQVS